MIDGETQQRNTAPLDQSVSFAGSQSATLWQEISRLGLIEVFEHDARPSVIIDLQAVDVAQGKFGRVYTNAAYDATPTNETWTKFERKDGRRIYIGPPDYLDWVYGYAPSPDPTPVVRNDIWVVSRVTLRSRWRVVSAARRNDPDESFTIQENVKAIPIPSTQDELTSMRLASSTPRSWSRGSDMARSTSGTKSPFKNPVNNLPIHPILRGIDWSLCSLGPPEDWPVWQRQFVSMIMTDMDPTIIIWKDRTVIYNEQVVPLIAQKHPLAMGSDAAISFSELWSLLEPMIEAVHKTKKPRRIDSMPLPILRRGYLEETSWTFTLVPIFNEEGEVEGVLDRFNEVTASMLASRRMDQIAQISEKTSQATSLSELWDKVTEVMDYHGNDTPYALLYSVEDKDGHIPGYSKDTKPGAVLRCCLKGAVGVKDHARPLFQSFNLSDQDHCLASLARQAFAENVPFVMRTADGTLPEELQFAVDNRGFGDVVNSAVVVPIAPTHGKAIGVMFKALNPRRLVDADYYAFMRLMARKLCESFAAVFLPQEERKYRAEVEKTAMDQANLAKQLLIRTKEAEHNASAFARLASNAPLGMFMYSGDGQPLYLNDYYFELTGISKENFTQFSWMDGVHPDDKARLMGFWDSLYRDKMPVTFEFRMSRPHLATGQDGSVVETEAWALASSFPQLDDDGEIINVIGWQIDISSQKWAQTLQKERLKDALESRTQAHRFIDMVSHECRNPLSAILQSADGILTALPSTSDTSKLSVQLWKDCMETVADSAQTIVLCAQHQKRIIDDILTVSKLDGNHLIITPDKADPVGLVQHVLKMYEAELEVDSIKTQIIVNEGYRKLDIDFVLLDPSRVLQILINMITNAIKFTAPQKKRRITVHVDASLKRPTEGPDGASLIPQRSARMSPATTHPEWVNGKDLYIMFSVQDTGRGMSPEEMERLFERFAQASPRTHVKYGGSGLGLFISRELTELQGGQVSVSSTLGLGSNFAFFVNARRSAGPTKNSQTPIYTPGPASNGSSDHPQSPAYPFPYVPSPNVFLPTSAPTSAPISTTNSNLATPTPGNLQTTPVQAPAAGTDPLHKFNVLIVEDNLINQKVMAKQLRSVGCVVHVANHGAEALEFLRRSEFSVFPPCICDDDDKLDVILMDIEMPVMDGITCVKEVRGMQRRGELAGHVPIIAVTANARDAQQAQAIEHGMDMVVTKPFRIPELIPKMHDLVSEIRGRKL